MNHKLNRHKRSKRPRQDRAAPCVSPGTTQPAYDGPPADIRVMAYGPSGAIEQHPADLDAIPGLLAGHPVVWVSVIGLDDAATICRVGKLFGIHPLALEDVVGYHEHPKSEPYGDHLLVIARVVRMDQELESDQFSMIVGRGFVVTFEQRPSALFEPLRQRIRSDQNGVLAAGPGYLAYSLLDYLIDGYFPVVEALGDRLEDLEDEALERPGTSCMQRIHTAKRDLRALRRAVWPLRDTLNLLARETSQWFDDDARMHLRDCFDHTARVIELTEMYRELGADLTELYLSSQSNRMNEVMRVLTIIATLFMPLSFITGVYGMNFNPGASKWNMPELNWRYGYPAVLVVLWVIAFSMLAFFYRKGWLKSFAPMSPPLDGPDAGHS